MADVQMTGPGTARRAIPGAEAAPGIALPRGDQDLTVDPAEGTLAMTDLAIEGPAMIAQSRVTADPSQGIATNRARTALVHETAETDPETAETDPDIVRCPATG